VDFSKEFGAGQLWRRQVNVVADDLCGKRAESLVDPAFVKKVRKIDKLVSSISVFLAERAEFILFPDKQDPPPMHFVERRKSKASGSVVSPSPVFNKSRGAARLAVRCKTSSPVEKVPPKANKRQRLQELLAHPELGNGHTWRQRTVAASTAAVNMSVSCERCNLYIEQINSPSIFDRKISHPCIGIPAALPTDWEIHNTHTMLNKGSFWACESCMAVVKVAAAKTTLALRDQCKGLTRKGGKVPKTVLQQERPKASQSKAKLFGVKESLNSQQEHRELGAPNLLSSQGPGCGSPLIPAPKPKPVPKPKPKPKPAPSPGSQLKLSFARPGE